MNRKNIYAGYVSGYYAVEVFVVAATSIAEAVETVKAFIENNSQEFGATFDAEDVYEEDFKEVAKEAAVEVEGILYHNGYAE